jgi:hypothetical protein
MPRRIPSRGSVFAACPAFSTEAAMRQQSFETGVPTSAVAEAEHLEWLRRRLAKIASRNRGQFVL